MNDRRNDYYQRYNWGGNLVRTDHTVTNDDDGSWNRTITFNRGVKFQEIEEFIYQNGLERFWSRAGSTFADKPVILFPTDQVPYFTVQHHGGWDI